MPLEVLPTWAQRIRRERTARGWSQNHAVEVLLAHGDGTLPAHENVLRRWKSWEAGEHCPSEFYQKLLARVFGTARFALFPPEVHRERGALQARTGMSTVEIMTRLQRSDVDAVTLDALRITVDRLCEEYPSRPAEQLVVEGRSWLQRVAELCHGSLTLTQHRETLVLAGWLALLVGCLEYDMGDAAGAEATRRAALTLGKEVDHGEIIGWAYELQAWFSLTRRDWRGVIAAARAGSEVAGTTGVAVQLAGQEAKAWARLRDRREVEVALDRGRRLLDRLPHPAANLSHHFVVDPSKWDFYTMDCYRVLGEGPLAVSLATDVLATPSAPMRHAEANVTLGVVAARNGDLEGATDYGMLAFDGARRSRPSLTLVASELGTELVSRYGTEPRAAEFMTQLRQLA